MSSRRKPGSISAMDTGFRRYDGYINGCTAGLALDTRSVVVGETFQMPSMILAGDVNLMNIGDPAVPFARIGEELRAADFVFANLECCLYQPPDGHIVEHEGFF